MCHRFFTKYAWVTPLNDKKGKTVLKVFMEIVNELIHWIKRIIKTKKIIGTDTREVYLNGNVYDFSVDYNSIDKYNILNIHNYLMSKNDIK